VKAGFFLRSSMWTGMGLLVLAVSVWFTQRRLERRHAMALAAAAASLVLATTFVFFIALFSMFLRPLL
jgi:type VI protein secretion system component VasK